MSKFVVLLNYNHDGVTHIDRSPDRADAFRSKAEKLGVKVDALLWTIGPHDGLLVLDAPDDATAAALVLGLAKEGNVSTCTLRAFDADEFAGIVDRIN